MPDMEDVKVEVAFDQSQYVRDALANLRMEALLRRRAGVAGGAAVPGELRTHVDRRAVDPAVGTGRVHRACTSPATR